MDFEDVSKNFSVAKVFSILMVFTGHFFSGMNLWVPTTFALFVFGFSSGFFTADRYTGNFSMRRFWFRKIERLACNLLIINLFLFIFFIASGKKNLYSWHTVVSLFGLTGFLNWFKIPNTSPFGDGLWFFTLMLIFYALYPVVSFLNRSKVSAFIFVSLSIIILTLLHFTIQMGHMLWLTAISFILGPFLYSYRFKLSPAVAFTFGTSSIIIMIALNIWFNIKYFNYFLILITSLAVVMFLLVYRLPRTLNISLIFSGCILEIYFISPYLSLRINGLPVPISYVLSLLLTLCTAVVLSYVATKLQELISFLKDRCKPKPRFSIERTSS